MTSWYRMGICLAVWFGAAMVPPLHAEEFASINAWAKAATQDLVQIASQQNASSVFVDSIKAAPSEEGSPGTRLSVAFETAIKQTSLSLSRQNYQIVIRGQFKKTTDPDTKTTGIEVTLRFENNDGDSIGKKTRYIHGEEATFALAGENKHIPPLADQKQREEILKAPPQTKLQGSKIKTAAASPYAVELLVKGANGQLQPRAAEVSADTNRPFVDILGQEVFAIRLYNDSDFEAAVDLTIDGITVFAFSTIQPQPRYWIVPARSHMDVLGWKITEAETDEFKSVEFPKSAAAELKMSHDERIGIINALFHAAWEDENRPPPGEQAGSKNAGRGDRIKDQATVVQRFIGKLRDSISVRYERELPR